jgi:cephalosporin hydroxylase
MTALTALVRAAAPFVVSLGILGGCDDKEPPPPTQEEVMRRFHELWYLDAGTWMKNSFFGIHTEQNPMDVWVTQEILHEVKPDFMIECGSMHGGSAALWATLLEQFNPEAKVISIDITDRMQEARKLPIVQRRVEFIVSSSTDKALVEKLAKRVKGKKVLVLLDSDHSKPHVLQELRSYSPMVSVGSYILVQGSNVNGHPVSPNSHPQGGPWEAIEEFMRGSDAFQIDTSRERLLFTLSPSGFLKRVK